MALLEEILMTYVMYNFDLGYVQVIDLPFRILNFFSSFDICSNKISTKCEH